MKYISMLLAVYPFLFLIRHSLSDLSNTVSLSSRGKANLLAVSIGLIAIIKFFSKERLIELYWYSTLISVPFIIFLLYKYREYMRNGLFIVCWLAIPVVIFVFASFVNNELLYISSLVTVICCMFVEVIYKKMRRSESSGV